MLWFTPSLVCHENSYRPLKGMVFQCCLFEVPAVSTCYYPTSCCYRLRLSLQNRVHEILELLASLKYQLKCHWDFSVPHKYPGMNALLLTVVKGFGAFEESFHLVFGFEFALGLKALPRYRKNHQNVAVEVDFSVS